MFSTSYRLAIIFSAMILLLAPLADATDTDVPQTDQKPDAPSPSLLNMTPQQALTLQPRDCEIRVLLLKERADVDALTARLAETHDNLAALRIQKEIGAKKQQTEIGIMEVQAKYADQAGRHEQATAIRKTLTGMKERLAVSLRDAGVEE